MRMVQRLGREDWVQAAMQALVAEGAGGLRVERLARRLNVSKGSFYWHFRDRAALRDAVLGYWEHRAFAAMLRPAGSLRDSAWTGRALLDALRNWAIEDAAVARALARVRAEHSRLPQPPRAHHAPRAAA